MPRFEAYASPIDPTRVMAGHTALRLAAEAGQSFHAGVWQTVSGLVPGTPLRFNAHGQIWASNGEDRRQSEVDLAEDPGRHEEPREAERRGSIARPVTRRRETHEHEAKR